MLESNREICLYLIFFKCGNFATRKDPKKQISSHLGSQLVDFSYLARNREKKKQLCGMMMMMRIR
jgi:hypothetical protein